MPEVVRMSTPHTHMFSVGGNRLLEIHPIARQKELLIY